jgi:hypothetical protein
MTAVSLCPFADEGKIKRNAKTVPAKPDVQFFFIILIFMVKH